MLTRRDFLKGAAVGADGIVTGTAVVTFGRRLLTASNGGGGITHPADLYNDEFDSGQGTWFTPELGYGLADFDNPTYPSEVVMGEGMAIARGSVPPTPFTVTARCSFLQYTDIETSFGNASLAVGDSSSLAALPGPDFYAMQWDVAFLGEIGLIDGFWPGYSGDNDHLGPYIELGGLEWEIPHYQRLVVHSKDNIDTYWSTDGTNWNLYDSGTNPDLDEVSSVLLLSYGCATRWDWIRFT